MTVLHDHLTTIMNDVWSAIFGEGNGLQDAEGEFITGPGLLAQVRISGTHPCMVTIACGDPVARQIAATMLSMPASDLTTADLQDALGEVANMAAGNLKALLPPGHHLSLPDVTTDAPSGGPGGHLRDRCAFRFDGSLLVARVFA
jgi:chemotaxis protein CheX